MRLKIVFLLCLFMQILGCSSTDLQFANGEKKALSDFQGEWLLVNYWASWCKPCIHEIPELNLVNAEPGIQVMGYNFDQLSGDALTQEVTKFEIAYPSLITKPDKIFDQTVPGGIPATMLIDPDGEFREWLMGPQTKMSILSAIEAQRLRSKNP